MAVLTRHQWPLIASSARAVIARCHPGSRRIAWLLVGGLLALSGSAQEIDEYQVKAAFLYNFAKFVEWPSQAFQTSKDPITVCVLGHNPFGNALEDVIRGKSIEGRPVVSRQVSDAEERRQLPDSFCGLIGT